MAEAARATLGINVWGYTVTDEDVGVTLDMSPGTDTHTVLLSKAERGVRGG